MMYFVFINYFFMWLHLHFWLGEMNFANSPAFNQYARLYYAGEQGTMCSWAQSRQTIGVFCHAKFLWLQGSGERVEPLQDIGRQTQNLGGCKMTSNVTEEGIEIKDSYRFENWSKLLGICLRTFLQALVEVVNKPFIL